ncbi:MAG: Hsp70 family protein [Spirulinaceae cyanobacterium SM2_1_0]|nr:Hsp70 family protein [Spirulinaceae cyanobacterium SM2_1_0]
MTAIAIDFGTSNTVVSILEPDTQAPRALRLGSLSRLFKLKAASGATLEIPVVPSLVYVKSPEELILGQEVRSQRLGLIDPNRLFKGFKRELAADFQMPPRQLDGRTYTAASIAEAFLHGIWAEVRQQGVVPTQLIFTLPVGAFERYLDWFRSVAEHLGVERVRFVDESTAAALGYGVQQPQTRVLAIDFGGGTLDLSLVRVAEVDEPSGTLCGQAIAKTDAYIGGEDADIWIVEDRLRALGYARDSLTAASWQQLLELAERLKIRLSSQPEATETWLDDETFTTHELHLNRDRLEELLERNQFLLQLREAIEEVLEIARQKGVEASQIEQVLLVGGSCLIPAVQQAVVDYFGAARVKLGKPFEATAAGALALTQLSGLEDRLRHSYAIRLWDANERQPAFKPLFPKGTKYPCRLEEPIILQVANEGQREIRLDVGELADLLQTEANFSSDGKLGGKRFYRRADFRSLGAHRREACIARLDPPGELGRDRLKVNFEVNDQRVLLATVEDLLAGQTLVEQGAIAKLR